MAFGPSASFYILPSFLNPHGLSFFPSCLNTSLRRKTLQYFCLSLGHRKLPAVPLTYWIIGCIRTIWLNTTLSHLYSPSPAPSMLVEKVALGWCSFSDHYVKCEQWAPILFVLWFAKTHLNIVLPVTSSSLTTLFKSRTLGPNCKTDFQDRVT